MNPYAMTWPVAAAARVALAAGFAYWRALGAAVAQCQPGMRESLRLRETFYKGRFDEPKTKRSARKIPIGEYTPTILAQLRPTNVNPGALVFANKKGRPLNRRNLLRRHFQATCKTLGLPRITWHTLRHASLLDAAGASLGTVQSLLGHASPNVTLGIYLHGIPSEERRAVENVEKLVFGPKRTQVLETPKSGELVSR